MWARGAQRRVPSVKNPREMRSISLRPKRSETAPMNGWKTADVRRYDVPAQKASLVVPPSSVASVCARTDGQSQVPETAEEYTV